MRNSFKETNNSIDLLHECSGNMMIYSQKKNFPRASPWAYDVVKYNKSFKFSLKHKKQFHYKWFEFMKEKRDNKIKKNQKTNNHDVNAFDK